MLYRLYYSILFYIVDEFLLYVTIATVAYS